MCGCFQRLEESIGSLGTRVTRFYEHSNIVDRIRTPVLMTEPEDFLTLDPSLHQLKVYFIIYLANKCECPSPPRGCSECKWRLRAPKLQKWDLMNLLVRES